MAFTLAAALGTGPARATSLGRNAPHSALRSAQSPEPLGEGRPERRKAFSDCLANDVCLFAGANYNGQMEHYQNCCDWIDLASKQIDGEATSWRNRLDVDVLLAKQADGGGDHLCLNNNDSDPQMGAAWDNEAQAIRIRSSDTIC